MITTTLRIEEDLYNKIVELALENRRSINNQLLIMLEKQIKEEERKEVKYD